MVIFQLGCNDSFTRSAAKLQFERMVAKPVPPPCDLVLAENLANVASCKTLCQHFAAESTH